jgi:nitrogen regulatory protein PII-like uncharacterized protein
MENSSSTLTKSILDTISESKDTSVASTTSSSDQGGFFGFLYSLSIFSWIIIILILAFSGFYIFLYLTKGPQDFTSFLREIIEKVEKIFGIITGTAIDTTVTGAKKVVDKTAEVLDTGLTHVENAIPEGKKMSTTAGGTPIHNAIPHADIMQNNTLNKSLNKTNAEQNIGHINDYVADDSTSSIQKSQTKGGYCYIGEERGNRSCVRVNENDTCMSGDIFPTREICINPSLRV